MCSSPRQSPETRAGHRAAADTRTAPLGRVRKQGPATKRLILVHCALLCSSPRQSPETRAGLRAAADTCAASAPQTGRDETHSGPC
jgi:hypothetical protein